MKYDIYFHNDFDGRASAAVMLAFLRSRGDSIEHFVPVDFDLQSQWLDDAFFKKHRLFKGKRNPPIVVDFPFHPGAAWWFDHHLSPFKKASWKKRFTPSKFRRYDPKYRSACHMVEASLREGFGWKPPKHIKKLIAWADLIDGAAYRSAKQTLTLKDPALQVDNFIDKTSQVRGNAEWMVKLFAEKDLAAIARIPKVKKVVMRERKKIAKNLLWYKKHLKLIGAVSFIDIRHDPEKFLRYAPYYLHPKRHYGVRFGMKGPLYHIGAGANPWKTFPHEVHIGKLMKKYGGGGHRGAGAADFLREEDAERALRGILVALNKK